MTETRNEAARDYDRLAEKVGERRAFDILRGIIAKSFRENKSVINGGIVTIDYKYVEEELAKQ